MKDHKKDNCYKLPGFPTDFKINKKSVANLASNSSPSSDAVTHVAATLPSPLLGKDQYNELVKLLKKEWTIKAKTNMASTLALSSS